LFLVVRSTDGAADLGRRGQRRRRLHIQDGQRTHDRRRLIRPGNQRWSGLQRVLAGGQLRNHRDNHSIRGEHPRAHEHLPAKRCERVRQGPGAKRRGDDGYERRRLHRLRSSNRHRFTITLTYSHAGWPDAYALTYSHAGWPDAYALTDGHAGWPDAHTFTHSYAGWPADADTNADTHTDTNTDADTDTDIHTNADTDTDTYADADTDTYADA
jgi:hypothetical protein